MKRSLGLLALVSCLAGCANDPPASDASNLPGNREQTPAAGQTDNGGAAQKAIEEADIVQLQGGNLYAISKAGTLSIIDVSQPGKLTLLNQVLLNSEPFEMYLDANRLVVMLASSVVVIDVRDPVLLQRVGSFPIAGPIVDSRLQGDLLYLVTGTNVTSFDLSVPGKLTQVAQVAVDGAHSIIFGNGRMYVGVTGGIDLIDVSDAKGQLVKGAHVATAGAIAERWQMSEKDEVLRVISQGAVWDEPTVETFTVWNARSIQPMAKVQLQLAQTGEALKAVRFDADRAYVITFRQTDPLTIVDLHDPAHPAQAGQLSMPGYIVDLEPRGDRLIGLGVDSSDPAGSLNVSLFDVSNLAAPKMLKRIAFGARTWAPATSLPEDQDRLQKAFRIGDDGLITVPFSGPTGQECTTGGAIQLVKIDNDTLYEGQQLAMAGNPRRALLNGSNQLVAVSDSNVTAFEISTATKTADVTIGTCAVSTTDRAVATTPAPSYPYYGDDDESGSDMFGACSAARRTTSTNWASILVGIGAVVGTFARRRASRRSA